MRDRKEFVLSFHEVLYVWFVVLLERLAYDVPADEVIPARTFECELAWTFYILEVFQNLIFSHGQRQSRNMDSVTDLVYVLDGVWCIASVVQALCVEKKYVSVSDDWEVECTVIPV